MNNPFETIDERLNNIEKLLFKLTQSSQIVAALEEDRWFDLKEVCNYLPDKPAEKTIYGWVNKNSIPFHKGSKKLRFLKSDIDKWMKEGKQKTIDEEHNEAGTYLKARKSRF